MREDLRTIFFHHQLVAITPARPGQRRPVSNSIQTRLRLPTYIRPRRGSIEWESCEYENWAGCAAHGERAASALWWNRTYRFIPDRRIGADGSRGDLVRQWRFNYERAARWLRSHRDPARRKHPRSHPLLHADAGQGPRRRTGLRHSAL